MNPAAVPIYNQLLERLRETETPCTVAGSERYTDNCESVGLDEAEEMCYNCPLLKLCYDYAVADNQKWGVWGGINFTEQEEVLFEL
jgi:hypothetical protein